MCSYHWSKSILSGTYRVHIGHPMCVVLMADMSTICALYIHIGYLICVVLMQKIGQIYYRHHIYSVYISGGKILVIYHEHIGYPIYYNRYRTDIR